MKAAALMPRLREEGLADEGNLVTAGTFEERIDAMLKAKSEPADMSVASGESWISRMGNEELRELFG